LPSTIRQALTVNVPEIRKEILARIRKAEDEHDVRVLLAVESGSRAWGFASPDSDYDARFIYVNRPDWYLSVGLEEQRDVIEYDIVDDIDLNGWDLRKALRLFWRSNPAFVEWIQSPIVYVEAGRLAAQVRALLPRVYSCTSGVHHYRSMARTNYRGYLRADQVPLKKYFYVLRPLLSVLWLEKYQTPAPIEFDRLLHLLEADAALLRDIQKLLASKRATPELGLAAPIPGINAFIERELARLETNEVARPTHGEVLPMLNEVFRQSLDEAWRGHRP
jgi:predicted nucleotidyltransferase